MANRHTKKCDLLFQSVEMGTRFPMWLDDTATRGKQKTELAPNNLKKKVLIKI